MSEGWTPGPWANCEVDRLAAAPSPMPADVGELGLKGELSDIRAAAAEHRFTVGNDERRLILREGRLGPTALELVDALSRLAAEQQIEREAMSRLVTFTVQLDIGDEEGDVRTVARNIIVGVERLMQECDRLAAEGAALRAENTRLREALDERDMFLNPQMLDKAADAIDCCPGCDKVSWESDTNYSECRASERGDYCPNDVAETLRALAKASRELSARAALSQEPKT